MMLAISPAVPNRIAQKVEFATSAICRDLCSWIEFCDPEQTSHPSIKSNETNIIVRRHQEIDDDQCILLNGCIAVEPRI